MRLLLLLSALLAALSGAGASARAPQAVAVAVAAGTSAQIAAPAHAHVLLSARPIGPPERERAAVPRTVTWLAAPRLWMQRRRE